MKRTGVHYVWLMIAVLPVLAVVAGCESLGADTDVPGGASTSEVTTTSSDAAASSTTASGAAAASTTVAAANADSGSQGGSSDLGPGPDDPNLSSEPIRCEENSWFMDYYPDTIPWKSQADPEASGGAFHLNSDDHCGVKLRFKGTGVRLIAPKGPRGAKMLVNLIRIRDAGVNELAVIDLHSTETEHQQVVWYSGYLPYGEYLVAFTADWRSAVAGSQYYIDAIDIWGLGGIKQDSGETYYPPM